MDSKIWQQQIKYAILGILTVYMSGCKKFVQIPAPNTQVVTSTVFNDNNTATAAMTSIYSAMQAESWNMSQNAGLLSDELQSPSKNIVVQAYYHNALLPIFSPGSIGPWVDAYQYIYQANAIIEGINMSSGLKPAAVASQLKGEAVFIRAFWYFYLVNCFGDVPLALSTDYKVNATLRRTPKADVYVQIINDLKNAKLLLSANYVDGSDTTVSPDRIRPNKATASALLARVYLFAGDYVDAATEAGSVMADSRYALVPNLNGVFLAHSSEAIWQLGVPSPNSYSTVDGFYYILTAAPAGGTAVGNTVTISPFLLSSFEPNDQRKINWIGSVTTMNPVNTYYFPYKYKSNSLPVTEYTMMLRLAEQYLIHAEALVRQNKGLDQAVADLNIIRARAGIGNYTGPEQQDSLLSAILHERQVELFTEWGHRWFDLARFGAIDTVMKIVNPQKGGLGWQPEWALMPIPREEILVDFDLSQNPGYN